VVTPYLVLAEVLISKDWLVAPHEPELSEWVAGLWECRYGYSLYVSVDITYAFLKLSLALWKGRTEKTNNRQHNRSELHGILKSVRTGGHA
jgi:hypothetical protein